MVSAASESNMRVVCVALCLCTRSKPLERVGTDGGRLQRSALYAHDPVVMKAAVEAEEARTWSGYDPRFADAGACTHVLMVVDLMPLPTRHACA